ncbi:MAG: 30S ribosomal protein S2 [Candidatus Bostrichicola ureolyticus]|nr:MAG: 30S ribosomal protein S2 [Candidatus Bostrichicola ureolyticus]
MIPEINIQELLKARVHFGHLTDKWNPYMKSYILFEKKGIHIIDLFKTRKNMIKFWDPLKRIASSGQKILFVCTKKQGKKIISNYAQKVNMPYVTERWLGGLLTNIFTIRKSITKMNTLDRNKKEGIYDKLSKKEQLLIERLQTKLNRTLGTISQMNNLPSAIIIVDINKEHLAVKEAKKLNIPIFAMVDTNSNPKEIDYPIPANDDSSKSIEFIISYLTKAINEGISIKKSNIN